jgi:hypothetical protein
MRGTDPRHEGVFMNGIRKLAAMNMFVLFVATGVSAQMGMGMRAGPPQIRGVWSPVVGQGAVYQISPQAGTKTEMEIAVLGKEPVEGKDGYWLQMAMSSSEMGGQMVMKHLFVLDGQDTHTARMIMQLPGRPPMEMPAQMMHRDRSTQPADVRDDAQDLGSESITVPAGTYATEHYRLKDGSEIWISKDVPPWGMVRYQGKDSTMVLVKVISEAKDKIIGTPQPFNPMMMGQPPQMPPR